MTSITGFGMKVGLPAQETAPYTSILQIYVFIFGEVRHRTRCYSESLSMRLDLSTVISVVSLVVSVTVAILTLLWRGTLRMTQPVQVAFVYENDTKAKIFLRTLLYATGKRGYVIEGLYLKVKEPDSSTQTFGFWAY